MNWLERMMSGWNSDAERRSAQPVRGDPDRVREVQVVLDELRPMFRADAGDVELLAIVDGFVEVRLAGACKTCHASDQTLFAALEPRLQERYSWVRGVRAG